MTKTLQKIVIVGGGAGGLELATSLGHTLGRHKQARVTLVDRNHSHLWKPLLHEVAAGSLDEGVNALSYIAHAHNHAFQFQFGCMNSIDREHQQIVLDEVRDDQDKELVPTRRLDYDIAVMALGSISNDFGTPGVKEHCMLLDDPHQAKRFYNKILNLFLRFSAQGLQKEKINIVIVGGGATGVELSAELYNTVYQLRSYGFKGLNNQVLLITLIEINEHILPSLPQKISKAVHSKLTKLGVRVLTKTMVICVNKEGVYTKNGEYIEADLIVWTAGIKTADFMKNIAGLETNHINQLVVKLTLQTTRDPKIFAIGDCASCTMSSGIVVPPRAQAAHQMASHVKRNILAILREKPLKYYRYQDYGSLVSLSHFSTFGNIMTNLIKGSVVIEGRIARIMYISLYRMHQIALHGCIKTGLIILVDKINSILKPRLKLH